MSDIQHTAGHFFIEREGKRIAELTYRIAGGDAIVDHTFVDDEFRGGTLARDLVDAAVQWARKEGHKVIAMCPYVRKVLDKRPDYADVKKA
jgi:predicted GNAT family acetyltransferase